MSTARFSDKVYKEITDYLTQKFGMECKVSKRNMLKTKIDNFMHKAGMDDYDDFISFLKKSEGSTEWHDFTHKITTHKTDFFRENQHFEFLKANLEQIMDKNRRIRRNQEIRLWSAGCSSGEEPYSMVMFFLENFPSIRSKILATDISHESLRTAIRGIYPVTIQTEVSPYILSKYFEKREKGYMIDPRLRNFISFRSFNLTKHFNFKKGFDIIFCRNVMIYFGEETRQKLINRFYSSLVDAGIFIIGHSESLINLKSSFSYIKPTIYMR